MIFFFKCHLLHLFPLKEAFKRLSYNQPLGNPAQLWWKSNAGKKRVQSGNPSNSISINFTVSSTPNEKPLLRPICWIHPAGDKRIRQGLRSLRMPLDSWFHQSTGRPVPPIARTRWWFGKRSICLPFRNGSASSTTSLAVPVALVVGSSGFDLLLSKDLGLRCTKGYNPT